MRGGYRYLLGGIPKFVPLPTFARTGLVRDRQGFGLFRVNTVEGSKISANDGHQWRGFDASVRFSLCFGRLFLFVGWFWLRENGLVELVDAAKLLDGLGVIINADVTVTVVEAAVSPTLADDE